MYLETINLPTMVCEIEKLTQYFETFECLQKLLKGWVPSTEITLEIGRRDFYSFYLKHRIISYYKSCTLIDIIKEQ